MTPHRSSSPADAERPSYGSNHLFAAMSRRPEIFDAFEPLHNVILGHGLIEQRGKMLMYLASSFVNESPYCVSRARAMALEAGFSDDELRAIQTEQNQDFPPIERTLLRMARELTRTCTIDDIHPNELNLFSQEQLVEIVSVIALANFDNRVANGLDVHSESAAGSSRVPVR